MPPANAPAPAPTALSARDLLRDLLTVERAAQYLQLSPSSTRSCIRQGRLSAVRVAGKRKVLIARADMVRLLEPARQHE